jgi:hypothetical protein
MEKTIKALKLSVAEFIDPVWLLKPALKGGMNHTPLYLDVKGAHA